MSSSDPETERTGLHQRASDFRTARTRGPIADWQPFFDGLSQSLRVALLAELIGIDLAKRWEEGERPMVEEYVLRFPEIGPIDRVPASLLVAEQRSRAKAGESYDLEVYRKRFPVQFPEVQGQLESVATASAQSVTETLIGAPHFPTPALAQTLLPGSPGPTGLSAATSSAAGEYEFLRLLGRGVFGEVWLAKKKTSGIEKAIKILTHPVQKDAAQRELRSLELIKNLRHPYLLSTEDFWVSDQRLHIVMELADCTLRDRGDSCRGSGSAGIPEVELLGYIREAAEGLDFLHAKHIVHRDVKPDNILILNSHSKVADFGLALRQDQVISPMRTFAGTPAYMAPEVWGKEGGPASDQYSLAVTYIEMRQGHPPFLGQQLEDMRSAHLEGSQAFDPIITEPEREVLGRALARQPENRYPTCMAFVEELSMALDVPVASRPGMGSFSGRGSVSARPASQVAETLVQKETVQSKAGQSMAPATGTKAQKSRKPMVVLAAAIIVGVAGVAGWAIFGRGNAGSSGNGDSLGNGTSKPNPAEKTLEAGSPIATPTPKTTNPNPSLAGLRLPLRAQRDPAGHIEEFSDGRRAYDWIEIPFGGEKVRFRLIPGGQGSPVDSFYMMESKVWNSLFRAGKVPMPAGSEDNGPEAPVTRITAEEAQAFASQAFGGSLPSPDEWDTAAGLYQDPTASLTLPDGRPRISLAHPEPTHGPNAGKDKNRIGLRDMAGNGREWTRKLWVVPDGEKDFGNGPLAASDRVILRGRCFTFSSPLTYTTLADEKANPQTQFATAGSPYTSFRVMVPLP